MTTTQFQAIRQRTEKATIGPWVVFPALVGYRWWE